MKRIKIIIIIVLFTIIFGIINFIENNNNKKDINNKKTEIEISIENKKTEIEAIRDTINDKKVSVIKKKKKVSHIKEKVATMKHSRLGVDTSNNSKNNTVLDTIIVTANQRY